MNLKDKLLTLLLVTFICVSCEDALDKFPQDKLSPGTYFTNENEIKLFTNIFYDAFPTAEGLAQESADMIVISELSQEVNGQRVVPDNGGGWSFGALRNINFYLENSANCTDERVRNEYDGLARFFRAYFYFEKVKRFGDVPWYDKTLESNDPDLYKPRDSREYVMERIFEDLDFAIEHLSARNHLYRVTRWSALALKSRIGLFEGTFRKYHGLSEYEKYLDYCIDASEIFMTESSYTIYRAGSTPYFDMFSTFESMPDEYILARDYDESLTLSHGIQQYLTSTTTGRPGVTKRIINSYLMADGSRFTDIAGYETMQFYDETQNRDPRLSQTIRTPGYIPIGDTNPAAPNFSSTLTGYHLIKFTNDKKYDAMKGYNDVPLFRTAEVYLNFAEAKAERGTLTQEDLNRSIKLIRDRVGMPTINMEWANNNPDPYLSAPATGYPNVEGVNKGVILEIRRERTIELIMEGFRYYDIMRWKEGKAFEQAFLGMYIPGPGVYDFDRDGRNDVCFYEGTPPSVEASLFLKLGENIELTQGTRGNVIVHGLIPRTWNEDRDYLYPIPIQERALTGGAISQNPGWVDGLNF